MRKPKKRPLISWFGVGRYRSEKVTGLLFNQYYMDFPQGEHDKRFKFPEKLVSLRRPEEGSRISKISPYGIEIYGFYINNGDCCAVNIESPSEFNRSVLCLGLDSSPEDMFAGLHRSVLYFLTHDEKAALAVGRGTLVVIQKWKE